MPRRQGPAAAGRAQEVASGIHGPEAQRSGREAFSEAPRLRNPAVPLGGGWVGGCCASVWQAIFYHKGREYLRPTATRKPTEQLTKHPTKHTTNNSTKHPTKPPTKHSTKHSTKHHIKHRDSGADTPANVFFLFQLVRTFANFESYFRKFVPPGGGILKITFTFFLAFAIFAK